MFKYYTITILLTINVLSLLSPSTVNVKVSVTPDYKLIQVFWVAMDKEKDDIIAELLTRSARDIRHELTQLRVIGVVPKIEFFKDKNALRILELEKRLEVADFGEDYLPPDPAERLKSKLELNLSLDPKIKVHTENFKIQN